MHGLFARDSPSWGATVTWPPQIDPVSMEVAMRPTRIVVVSAVLTLAGGCSSMAIRLAGREVSRPLWPASPTAGSAIWPKGVACPEHLEG